MNIMDFYLILAESDITIPYGILRNKFNSEYIRVNLEDAREEAD